MTLGTVLSKDQLSAVQDRLILCHVIPAAGRILETQRFEAHEKLRDVCGFGLGREPIDGVFLRGLAITPEGTVYVAAAGCGAVLRIDRGGVTAIHRTTSPWSPTAVAVAGHDVFVLEYLHTAAEDRQAWLPRVRQLRSDGTSAILATITRR